MKFETSGLKFIMFFGVTKKNQKFIVVIDDHVVGLWLQIMLIRRRRSCKSCGILVVIVGLFF